MSLAGYGEGVYVCVCVCVCVVGREVAARTEINAVQLGHLHRGTGE